MLFYVPASREASDSLTRLGVFQPPRVSGQDSICVSTAAQVFDPGQDSMRQTGQVAQHAYGVLIHSIDISRGPHCGLGVVLSAGVRN